MFKSILQVGIGMVLLLPSLPMRSEPKKISLLNTKVSYESKIIYENVQETIEVIKQKMKFAEENKLEDSSLLTATEKLFKKNEKTYDALYRNKENVKFVLDAMFRSTNEIYGTSFSSRIESVGIEIDDIFQDISELVGNIDSYSNKSDDI